VVFKMESHNHPSYIEPYQGAATGVGGILRDVFTMGARPIAAMNALRFGEPGSPERPGTWSHGVVAGIGGYGNSFGVPTVGGEVSSTPLQRQLPGQRLRRRPRHADKIFYSAAKGVGLPVVYLGAKTGRDGVGGATMASAEFDDTIEEKRPTVQVGDPFTEKRLLEACLELMADRRRHRHPGHGGGRPHLLGGRDGRQGRSGHRAQPRSRAGARRRHDAYEMMLSESQERMLMVLAPKRKKAPRRSSSNGASTSPSSARPPTICASASMQGEKSPTCRSRNWATKPRNMTARMGEIGGPVAARYRRCRGTRGLRPALLDLIGSPNNASALGLGAVRHADPGQHRCRSPVAMPAWCASMKTAKALAFSSDVTPRYVEADPFEGGKQAVAEVWRNLTATGADPVASTDNLNFGNPEKPEIMGSWSCHQGHRRGLPRARLPHRVGQCLALQRNQWQGILPTPAIGGVGIIPDVNRMATIAFKNEGDAIILIGGHGTHLGQSMYLREVLGREEGTPPPVDLDKERKHGDFVRLKIRKGRLNRCPRHIGRRAGGRACRDVAGLEDRLQDRAAARCGSPRSSVCRRPGPLCGHLPPDGCPSAAVGGRRCRRAGNPHWHRDRIRLDRHGRSLHIDQQVARGTRRLVPRLHVVRYRNGLMKWPDLKGALNPCRCPETRSKQ
jgi:hypothetical protein